MRSDHYIHPDFGYLAPTRRFRRELRVGLLSMLFGIGIGVVAVSAVSLGGRDHDRGSEPTQKVDYAMGASKTDPSAGDKRNSALVVKGGSSPQALLHRSDSPAIARVPLGRSNPLASGTIQSDVPLTSAIETIPLPREKPRNKARSQNTPREERVDSQHFRGDPPNIGRTARADGERQATRPGRSSARASSPSPRGFWAWSW